MIPKIIAGQRSELNNRSQRDTHDSGLKQAQYDAGFKEVFSQEIAGAGNAGEAKAPNFIFLPHNRT